MKTIFTLLLFLIFISSFLISHAQVLCIRCYNQNARVLTDTNNLIVNGGFENSTCIPNADHASSFCPNSIYYNCAIANWTCTGGGDSTYACIIDTACAWGHVAEGTKAIYFGNAYCNTCSAIQNDTSCITNTGCEVTGIPSGYPSNTTDYGGAGGLSLAQTINGLTPGLVYELEFWAGGESAISIFINKGLFAVDVGFGNIFLRNSPTPPDSGTRFVIIFTATSSSHTIKFTNWGHIGGNVFPLCTELILDDVRLFAANPDETLCATTILEHPQATCALFPNPATNHLNITTNTTHSSEIVLYDITSRKMMEEKFSGQMEMNISHLTKGIYLYQVKDDRGGISVGKVVKE